MAKNIGLEKIKEKRETLVGQFNSLQDKKKELLKQHYQSSLMVI